MKACLSLCFCLCVLISSAQFQKVRDHLYEVNEQLWELSACCPDSALKLILDGTEQAERYGFHNLEIIFWMRRGDIFLYQSQLDKASQSYMRAYELSQKYFDAENQARSYINFGNAASAAESIAYHRKALAYFTKEKDTMMMRKCLNNIGARFLEMEQLDSSRIYIERAMDISAMGVHDQLFGGLYLNYSMLTHAQGDIPGAQRLAKKAISIFRNLKDERDVAMCQIRLARIMRDNGDLIAARTLVDSALSTATQISNSGLIKNSYRLLCDISIDTGDWKSAYHYKSQADSIALAVQSFRSKNLINLKVVELENKRNKHALRTARKESRLNRRFMLTAIGFSVVVVILAVFIFFLIRSRTRLTIRLAHEHLRFERRQKTLMQDELEIKRSQLNRFAGQTIKNHELLQSIYETCNRVVRSNNSSEVSSALSDMRIQLINALDNPEMRLCILSEAHGLNRDIIDKLKERFQGLTENDLEMFTMIMMNMNIKESSVLLNIEEGSVATRRYRLRKKLGMKTSDTFEEFIGSLNS